MFSFEQYNLKVVCIISNSLQISHIMKKDNKKFQIKQIQQSQNIKLKRQSQETTQVDCSFALNQSKLELKNQQIFYNQLLQMPKTPKPSQSSTKVHKQYFADDQLQPQAHQTEKTHPIRKRREKHESKNEESAKQLSDIFFDLITLVNQQFSKNANLFKQDVRQSKLTPIQTKNGQTKGLQISILPTIYQTSKVAQQQQETIKKEKEQTQITSNHEKF